MCSGTGADSGDPGEGIDRSTVRAVCILDGVALTQPVLEAADHLAHGVTELRELERALGAGIASGAPAIHDDRGVERDLLRGARSDLAVVHVDRPGNACARPGLVRTHVHDIDRLARLA